MEDEEDEREIPPFNVTYLSVPPELLDRDHAILAELNDTLISMYCLSTPGHCPLPDFKLDFVEHKDFQWGHTLATGPVGTVGGFATAMHYAARFRPYSFDNLDPGEHALPLCRLHAKMVVCLRALGDKVAATNTDPCTSSKIRRERAHDNPIDVVNCDSIYHVVATIVTPLFENAHRAGLAHQNFLESVRTQRDDSTSVRTAFAGSEQDITSPT
jgi:hypothetical protein